MNEIIIARKKNREDTVLWVVPHLTMLYSPVVVAIIRYIIKHPIADITTLLATFFIEV